MDNRTEDNFLSGYVRLYRSLANKGWYTKSEYVHLWLHILIKANHTGREFFFNGKNIKVESGQFITGRKQLEIETGINESKIERILNFLEKNEHQIEQQKTTKNRLISVLNWDNYQNKKNSEQQGAQQLNNERTTTEQQLNTNNNDKELKNNKELNKVSIKTEVETSSVDYQKFVDKFNSFAGRKYRVTDKVKKALSARLKDYTKSEIIAAIEKAHKDEFHINSKFNYLTPEFILRPDKLEKFLNQTSNGLKQNGKAIIGAGNTADGKQEFGSL